LKNEKLTFILINILVERKIMQDRLIDYIEKDLRLEIPLLIMDTIFDSNGNNLQKCIFNPSLKTPRMQLEAFVGVLYADNYDTYFIKQDDSIKEFAEKCMDALLDTRNSKVSNPLS
jgi:hypothetical protein